MTSLNKIMTFLQQNALFKINKLSYAYNTKLSYGLVLDTNHFECTQVVSNNNSVKMSQKSANWWNQEVSKKSRTHSKSSNPVSTEDQRRQGTVGYSMWSILIVIRDFSPGPFSLYFKNYTNKRVHQ